MGNDGRPSDSAFVVRFAHPNANSISQTPKSVYKIASLRERNFMIEDNLIQLLKSISENVRKSDIFTRFVSPSALLLKSGEGEEALGGRILHDNLPEYLTTLIRPGKTIFVLGGPGSGKTMLWYVLTEAASRIDPPLLPIPINVQTLALAVTRKDLIREALPHTLISDNDLQSLDADKRLLLLIDGLNEIEYATTINEASKRIVRAIVRGSEECAVLATSRSPIPPNFQISGPVGRPSSELVLLPFTADRIWAVVAKHPEVNPDKFAAYLENGRLYNLASNPQLLSILIEVFLGYHENPAPRSVAELFELFFNKKWAEKASLVNEPDIGCQAFKCALASLAWHSRLHGLHSVSTEKWVQLLSPFDNLLQRDGLSRQSILDRAHALYLMELHGRDLAFVHERFIDHFAAYFLNKLGTIPDSAWYGDRWERIIAHLAGLQDNDGFRYILDRCLELRRVALACQVATANFGRLSGKELDKVFAFTAFSLYGPRGKRDEAVRGLGEFATWDAIDGLRKFLPNAPVKDRSSIHLAIDLLRRSRFTPKIFQNARQRDARKMTGERDQSLRKQKIPFDINAASNDLKLLADQNAASYTRGAAAKRLGLLGDWQAVPALMESLQPKREPDSIVRGSAATALGNLGDRQAVPALMESLQPKREPDSIVRGSVATALGNLGDRQAVPALMESLQPKREPDPKVRGALATALGNIGDRQAVPALMENLQPKCEPDSIVRGSVATALGNIGDRLAVPALIESLQPKCEPDPKVRGAVTNALGNIGDRLAVPALIESLQPKREPDPKVRSSAITALGNIGDLQSLPTLLTLTDDPDAWVRSSVAKALTRIGGQDASKGLAKLLQDTDPIVRGTALSAYRSQSAPSFFNLFLQILENDKEEAINRTNAVKALALTNDPKAMEPLLKALWDPNAAVRGESARGLVHLLPYINTQKGEDIAKGIVQFWIQSRHSDASNAVYQAIKELPATMAERTLEAFDSDVRNAGLPQSKLQRWDRLRQEIALAAHCSYDEALLKKDETLHLRRVWGLEITTVADQIENDLRHFVEREEENLWKKLADYGFSQASEQRNRKEQSMRDFMESHWRGLGRGDVLQEVRIGSGRVDLWVYYSTELSIFELKMLESVREDYENGLSQLLSYLRQKHARYGALILFAETKDLYDRIKRQIGDFINRSIQKDTIVFTVIVRVWKESRPSGKLE